MSETSSKLITWGSYFPSWWKCIFLWSIWSWSLSGTGYWPGQTLSLMLDGRSSAQLSNVCMKKSWWNKQVSSGNAFPPAKVILYFDDVHDSISVLQTHFLPTEYDIFSKSCKTVILPTWREKYPEISVTLKEVWNQNTPGRDLLIQGDGSRKGRQL